MRVRREQVLDLVLFLQGDHIPGGQHVDLMEFQLTRGPAIHQPAGIDQNKIRLQKPGLRDQLLKAGHHLKKMAGGPIKGCPGSASIQATRLPWRQKRPVRYKQNVVLPDPGAPMTNTGPPWAIISSAASRHSEGIFNAPTTIQLLLWGTYSTRGICFYC